MKKKFLLMALVAMYCLSLQAARPADGGEPAAKRVCVEEPNPLNVLAAAVDRAAAGAAVYPDPVSVRQAWKQHRYNDIVAAAAKSDDDSAAAAESDDDDFDHGGGVVLQCNTCKRELFSPDEGTTIEELVTNAQKKHFELDLCEGDINITGIRVLTKNEQAIGITQGLYSGIYNKPPNQKVWSRKNIINLLQNTKSDLSGSYLTHEKEIVYYILNDVILYVTKMDASHETCTARISNRLTTDKRKASEDPSYICPYCGKFSKRKTENEKHTKNCTGK